MWLATLVSWRVWLVRRCAAARVLLALCLPLALTGAWAVPLPAPVTLGDTQSSVPLANQSQFLVDVSGHLSVADVEARQALLPFSVRPGGHTLLLTDGDVLWIRFVARVNGREDRWLLQIDLPGVDEATLYYRDAAGALVVQRAGDSLAQSHWAERGRMPFFSLSPEIGREITYLVRIRHDRVPFSGGLFLKTQATASEQEQRAQFFLGAYFGLAALAVFVALANALVYRDRGFGAYSIYVLTMILGQAGITGVGGMLFWPEMPALNNPMTFFMPLLAGALGVWFVRIVATPQQYSTLLDRLAVSIILGLIAVAGAKIWVDNKVDFSQNKNLIVAAITLILGTGDFTLKFGQFALGGIGTATFGAIVLYALLNRKS